MKLVIFGLAVSSSWGNGHAVLWRALIRALAGRGHWTVFFERDVPYYAAHRDLTDLAGGRLFLYRGWAEAVSQARREVAGADAAIVTSYCPDALAATDLALSCPGLHVFYDLDTPVTLARLSAGEPVAYIGEHRLAPFDLVLSYTGGSALSALCERLGARRVAALYGSVDPDRYRPFSPAPKERAALSYLGTFADDRQAALDRFFIEPARHRPQAQFILGGAQYPVGFAWTDNIHFLGHVPPGRHSEFYASARLTLNVTRSAMSASGWCPSGRLFEAAACAAPIISDWWKGLEDFFEPGREILIASTTEEVLSGLDGDDAELGQIGAAARERVLGSHTAAHRAAQLETLLADASRVAEA
jgi:spore maturation protein CgeB